MKALWIILLLLLPLSMAAAEDEEAQGSEKILETIRKIQEEAEEDEADSGWNDDDDDGCSGCSLILDGCGEFGGELFWEYMIYINFAPYPYAPSVDYYFSEVDYRRFAERKSTSVQASADLSNHFDGTYGNTNRFTVQLSAVQLNVFNQTIFASSVSLSTLSVNAGLSLLVGGFDLSGFAGTYVVTTTGTFLVSGGISTRIFLPGRVYLDLYSLYAYVSENAGILHLIGSLNFAIWRLSIGAGYNFNLFVDDIYAGPCLKISFWF